MIHGIEREHFWFLGRRKLVVSLMEKSIGHPVGTLLDVGCGTGFNLQYWCQFADQVIGLDRLSGHSAHQRASGGQLHSVTSDVCALPVQQGSADVAVALDVLEHVPDTKMLAEVNRCLRDGGLFFVTVPAMQWLWSSRDEAAGHLRRYNRKTFRSVIEDAGFEILYLSFYQCLLFPVVMLSRIMGRTRRSVSAMEEQPGKLVNSLFNCITQLEVWLTQLGVRFPFGSTLVAVVRKAPMGQHA